MRPVDKKYPINLGYLAPYPDSLKWVTYDGLHHGYDYAAPLGIPVINVTDGIVTEKGYVKGYGNCVKIKFWVNKGLFKKDMYRCIYGHLQKILPIPDVGKKIAKGVAIGLVDSTGSSSGNHLHFEIQYWNGECWKAVSPSFVVGVV